MGYSIETIEFDKFIICNGYLYIYNINYYNNIGNI